MVKQQEKIINLPNFITSLRVPLTLVAVYYLLLVGDRFFAALFLALAGITDFLDGQWARRFDRVTMFGEKFDVVADRIFITIFAIALIFFLWESFNELILLFLCLSREIVAFPAFIYRRMKSIPYFSATRFIGKVQTTLQAFAFVFLTWGVSWSVYFVVASAIVGVFSGASYWRDSF